MLLHLASEQTQSVLSQYDSDQVQPNAVDLRVNKIFESFSQVFIISEEDKQHRETRPVDLGKDGWWRLEPGSYEIVMEGTISIGEDEAGLVVARSSLNRNGCFITSGLYDSGYEGVMAGVLHVNNGPMMLKPGTRVGQFLLFKADTMFQYDGDYGAGKQHDNKYGV